MCVQKKKVNPDTIASPPSKSIEPTDRHLSEHHVAPTASQTSLKPISSQKLKVKNSSTKFPKTLRISQSSVSHTSTSKQNVEKPASLITEKKSSIMVNEESKDSGVLRPNKENRENSTPTQEERQTPLQHVLVDPPKKMYARRKIDKTREAKDAGYKTLTVLDKSEWEEAEVVRRVDLKKEEPRAAASRQATESRRSARKKREENKEEGGE